MSYFKFMCSRLKMNKYNLMLTVFISLIVLMLFALNFSNQKIFSYESMLVKEIETVSKNIEEFNYEQEGYDFLHNIKVNYELSFNKLKENNYKESYDYYIKNLNKELDILRLDKKHNSEPIRSHERNLQLFSFLKTYNILKESESYPVTFVMFTFNYINHYIPIILIFIIITISTYIFTTKYFNQLNTTRILPTNKLKIIFDEFAIVYLSCFKIIGFSILVIGMLTIIFSYIGNIHYPIEVYNPILNRTIFNPIGKLILPLLLIQTLSITLLMLLSYIVSMHFKDQFTSFFFLLFVISILTFGFQRLDVLKEFNVYNPFIYFNSLQVITGDFAQNINSSITFYMGIKVLFMYILFSIIYIIFFNIRFEI